MAGIDGHAASLSPATATSSASASGVSLVRVRSPAGLGDRLVTPSGNRSGVPGQHSTRAQAPSANALVMAIRRKRPPNKGWVGSVTSTSTDRTSLSISGVSLCVVAEPGRRHGVVVHRRRCLRPGSRLRQCCRALPRGGRRRAATRDRGAERHGRDRTHTARPTPPARRTERFAGHRRTRPHGLAECVRLHRARQSQTGISRFKQVIGDGLRSHTDKRQATEVGVAVHVLNRMLELGRPSYVRGA